VNKADLRGLLAAVERARKTLDETNDELICIAECLQEAINAKATPPQAPERE
jgi:hypothetical protein